MKPSTPVITLLAGTTLGVAVLVASMLQTSSAAPVNYAATSPASTGTTVTLPVPASSTAIVTLTPPASSVATSTPTASASPTVSSVPTTAPVVSGTVPAGADYAAQVEGGGNGAAVAVSVHEKKAVAYVCDGHKVGHWFSGTVKNGKLDLAGQNGAHITLNYRSSKAAGYVMAEGHQYTFSAPTLHGRSGLYESTAMVHGVKVKFGWIVLPNGYQVGSAIANPDSADPQATPAPPLDAATGTAEDEGVVLIATLISGVTGSGF
jgi:serine/threonine-protein kinase